jgi:hypothetical protein
MQLLTFPAMPAKMLSCWYAMRVGRSSGTPMAAGAQPSRLRAWALLNMPDW